MKGKTLIYSTDPVVMNSDFITFKDENVLKAIFVEGRGDEIFMYVFELNINKLNGDWYDWDEVNSSSDTQWNADKFSELSEKEISMVFWDLIRFYGVTNFCEVNDSEFETRDSFREYLEGCDVL